MCRSDSRLEGLPGRIARVTDADLAERYSRTVQAVEAVLARADIEGFIAAGSPSNEYSPEAPELARLILRQELNKQTLRDYWLARLGPSSRLSSGNGSLTLDRLLADLLTAADLAPRCRCAVRPRPSHDDTASSG